MGETDRRRKIQADYNKKHGITPTTIKRKISEGLGEAFDGSLTSRIAETKLKYSIKPNEIRKKIEELKATMKKMAQKLEFEEAAKIRDEVRRLELLELETHEGTMMDSGSEKT